MDLTESSSSSSIETSLVHSWLLSNGSRDPNSSKSKQWSDLEMGTKMDQKLNTVLFMLIQKITVSNLNKENSLLTQMKKEN